MKALPWLQLCLKPWPWLQDIEVATTPGNQGNVWVILTTDLGEMKSSPLAPSPVKHRWMLAMNFLKMNHLAKISGYPGTQA